MGTSNVAIPARGYMEMQRLECRVPADLKSLVEEAARIQGVTVSNFVTSVIQRAASETVERHHRTTVSAQEWREMMRSLEETDLQPSPESVEDLALYQRHFGREALKSCRSSN